jgi:hypothetical protein
MCVARLKRWSIVIAVCLRRVRSKTSLREKQKFASYWPPPPQMFSIVCAFRYKYVFQCFVCTFIPFSHLAPKSENETWKRVVYFYALVNVILPMIHFRRSVGQATRVSEGQKYHFYAKRVEPCRMFCKVQVFSLIFILGTNLGKARDGYTTCCLSFRTLLRVG